jgi:integrase
MSIRKRGPRSYQVRVSGFPARTAPTRDAAETIELELLRQKALGDLFDEVPLTLGEAIDATLEQISGEVGPKTRALTTSAAKFWASLRAVPVASLPPSEIEDMISERAERSPHSARNELAFLKRVLRAARDRGQRVDAAILEIPAVRHSPREHRTLTLAELHELASLFPRDCARLILLAGQVGCRQSVWFGLTEEMVDLDAGTLTLPPELAKDRRVHRIELTDVEVGLLREQLQERPTGTNLVFPTPEGNRWLATRFRDRMWVRCTASSAYEGITFHTLRHTAGSLMALAKTDASIAARRLEHADGGALFHRRYRSVLTDEAQEPAPVLATMDGKWTTPAPERREAVNHAISEARRYWAEKACVRPPTMRLSLVRGIKQLYEGGLEPMRSFSARLNLGLIAAVALTGVLFAVVFGGATHTAAPVASSVSGTALDTRAPHSSVTGHLGVSRSPVTSKPQQVFLTRAHSAVFNVRKLKSVVVKQERPEVEGDPFGPPGGDSDAAASNAAAAKAAAREQAAVTSKYLPAKLPQSKMVKSSTNSTTPSADASFDGLDFATWGAGHPPDENGDVGPNYYIQSVNSSLGIYDKSTGNRVAAFTFNTFMSQGHFGNLCDNNNFGDPVVLYDTYEGRWFVSDFAFQLSGGNVIAPAYQCFAVSKTNDPVNGGWNFYSIQSPGALNDYPKFGIWPDGIYMSSNLFSFGAGGTYQSYHVWALNKQQMYAGAPTVQVVDFNGNSGDFTVIPANSKLAAGAPPTGSPEYFISTEQFLNALSIYKFQVNWDKPSTSTFTGPVAQGMTNCWPNASVPNASTPANAADTLSIRAMAAAQYTNIGGHESVWVSHTVRRGVSANATTCNAPTTGNATIRWYQANVTGGTIAANVDQSSSYDPENANTFFRFQPALAVDHMGDLGITYTKSNASTFPQIMFNGQQAGVDPTNTLGTESTLIAGTGAQSGNCGGAACVRWGDYAGMELDPDGCEFWMTDEYFAVSGLNDLTRIGSFHYPSCTPVGNGTLSGTVTDGTNPLMGVTVSLGSRTTTTDISGAYSFTVPAGTYPSLLADKAGYTEGSATTLAIPDGGSTTHDFTLSTAATSGCFTDDSQSLFQRGTPSSTCDINSSPGSVKIGLGVDQQNTAGTSTGTAGVGPAATNLGGQTFIAGKTGPLNQVDFSMFCSACTANPDLIVSIRATSAGLPTGGDLVSTTIAGDNSGNNPTFVATFSSPITVTSGTQYALVVRPNGSTGGAGYQWIRSSPSTYAGGSKVTSTNGGTSWVADTARDMNFHTYVGYAPSATLTSGTRDANPAAGFAAHWTTLSWTATTPANTSVRFQVAGSSNPYGPWNYVGPDGTASTFFTNSGASLGQFTGYRYLRYEAFLSSSDVNSTPTLSSVSTCFQNLASTTTLGVDSASGTYGGTTTLTATLTTADGGVAGKTVNFTLNGSPVGGATTDGSGVATLSNASLAGINAGSYPTGVGASFAGDLGYGASSGSNSLTIAKADQSITINTHAPSSAAVDDQFTVDATSSSGNAVTYGSSGSCSNTGATYTITDTGTCTVIYDQAGDSNYNAAPQLTENVNSNKANQTIHFGTHAPSSAVYGTQFTVAATGGNSGNPVVYGSSGGCSNSGATYTMTSGSTDCVVTYDQDGNSKYNPATQVTETVTAQKADQTIDVTTSAPSFAVYNTSFDVAANAPSGPVTFSSSGVCSNTDTHVTMTSGTGTCTVHYNQAGDANYNAAPEVTEDVAARKATQSITFAPIGDKTYGDSDFDPGATSSSGYAVSYSASGNCSIVNGYVHITGAGSCTVTASQPGDADFNAAPSVQQSFSIAKAGQTLTITTHAPSSAVYGSYFTVAATGGASGNPVTYSSSGVCSNNGATFRITGAGTCTVHYNQAGDANYNAAPQVTETVTDTAKQLTLSQTKCTGTVYGTGQLLTVPAGKTCGMLSGTLVKSTVVVKPGGTLYILGGVQIGGSLKGGGSFDICGARIGRDVVITNGPVILGGQGCDGNKITGLVKVTNDASDVSIWNNRIGNTLTVDGLTGAHQSVIGNTVFGAMVVQNSGPIEVTNNHAQTARCPNNTGLTGSGNTASGKNSCPA